MYEEYFGLKRSPFRITPDTSLFYDGGQRGDILGALVYAVHRGEGIVKVVGEVGSGKTMLCRMLQLELPENVEVIYIANPSVSAEDILFVIANELKFNIASDASKHQLVTMLQNYLLKRHEQNRQVVLFVEEAQGMPLETLEEIRLLSNLETDQHKLLQIILFGQPELDQNLADNSIRQLRERITHDFQLSPLKPDQIHSYLNFRMREVGYTGPELISEKLARKMAIYSQGLLRRINILADKMLLSAFADGTHTLTNKHLLDAVKDSGFSRIQAPGRGNDMVWWVFLLGLILIAVMMLGLFQNRAYLVSLWDESKADQSAAIKQQAVKPGEEELVSESADEYSTQAVEVEKIDLNGEMIAQTQLEQKRDWEKIKRVLQTAPDEENVLIKPEMQVGSKKIIQSDAKLDKVAQNQAVDVLSSSETSKSHEVWLAQKIAASIDWLKTADRQGVSIQVMMRNKDAAQDLATYLQTDWPLDLEKTYLYEVNIDGRQIYRVFYNEYPTISLGQMKMKQLPDSVRRNSPYLHSIYRMQKALL